MSPSLAWSRRSWTHWPRRPRKRPQERRTWPWPPPRAAAPSTAPRLVWPRRETTPAARTSPSCTGSLSSASSWRSSPGPTGRSSSTTGAAPWTSTAATFARTRTAARCASPFATAFRNPSSRAPSTSLLTCRPKGWPDCCKTSRWGPGRAWWRISSPSRWSASSAVALARRTFSGRCTPSRCRLAPSPQRRTSQSSMRTCSCPGADSSRW
mmetsp:Transcript_52062/g.161299  ORF Transcript_52062/g.161299 Transcript_52062/m.161299 type:complete len:210 (-) Transcript_52062:237-866(-)